MAEQRFEAAFTRRALLGAGAAAMFALAGGHRIATARQSGGNAATYIAAGLDTRANYGDYNSDVLMIGRVDAGAGTVRVISIPRDLYVPIPGFGQDKITRAFDFGYKAAGKKWDAGADLLTETIATAFGITIDGIATTTFEGFKEIIDAVGGVDVDNPYEVVGNAEFPVFPAGVQTLTGDAALAFVRTRTQDSDDGRVMRQQLVLEALLQKLQSPAIVGDLPALLNATRGTVETDIPLPTQLRLLELAPSLSRDNIAFTTITEYLTGGFIDNGMWVYQADWTTLPGIVQAFLGGDV
jgi:LCP family protein required for cell wall assembly